MAYYLAVETEKGIYEALQIKKERYFKQSSEHQDSKYECTIDEIEAYTTQFKDYQQMSAHLTSYGILRYRDLNKPLAIFYVNGIETKQLEGDILYQESKPFLENPVLVIDYIQNRIKEEDTLFLRKLNSTLPDKSIITYMVAILATSIETNHINQLEKKKQKPINQNLVSKIPESLIYDCYLDGSGELINSSTIDKEALHKIVSFITDYEKELNLTKINYVRKKEKP